MLTLSYTIKNTGSEGLYFISPLQLIHPPFAPPVCITIGIIGHQIQKAPHF